MHDLPTPGSRRHASLTSTRVATLAITVAALTVVSVGCTASPVAPASVADWCWLHLRLAPPGALVADNGPSTRNEAAAWITWLDATTPAPGARDHAQRRQLELIERFAAHGAWTPDEQQRYVAAAVADPSPSTTCESVGARVIPHPDGTLATHWEERFVDPEDPAFSQRAFDASRGPA